ncbi:hypothetical protein OG216_19945 [Streptomycetaceae bacterium NBC_01309]
METTKNRSQAEPGGWLGRRGAGSAVLAWVLAVPVVTVAWVDDMDDPTAEGSGLRVQRMFEPWVTGAGAPLVGALGVFLLAAASVAIAVLAVRGKFDVRWWGILVGAAAVGIPAGWAYRVGTAAYVDANIVGPLALLAVVLWMCLILPFVIAGAVGIIRHPDDE